MAAGTDWTIATAAEQTISVQHDIVLGTGLSIEMADDNHDHDATKHQQAQLLIVL